MPAVYAARDNTAPLVVSNVMTLNSVYHWVCVIPRTLLVLISVVTVICILIIALLVVMYMMTVIPLCPL